MAKHSRHSLEMNLFLPFFVSRHCALVQYSTCRHLTQPSGLASTAVQAACSFMVMLRYIAAVLRWRVHRFNSQRSLTTLPI